MGLESIHGLMEECMKVNIKMIRNMVKATFYSKMEINMMANGKMDNNMVKGYSIMLMDIQGEGDGKKVKMYSGLNMNKKYKLKEIESIYLIN